MPLHVYFVQAIFIIMGISLVVVVRSINNAGSSFLGKPSLNKVEFYTGKISLFSSWGLFIYRSVDQSNTGYNVPPALSWIAVGLLALATILLILSFKALGKSLKVGLPREETKLMTGGLYRFSRNPLYLGVFMVCTASCIYFPHPVNIVLALYGMFVHVRIILAEEKFLAERFGEHWLEYRKRVRRFI